MKLTPEQKAHTFEQFPDNISHKLLEAIIDMMPDTAPLSAIIPMMRKDLVEFAEQNIPDEEILKIMKSKMGNGGVSKDHPGNSNTLARKYFDSLLLEMRLMGAKLPTTEKTMFGHTFSSPVMTAAFSHLGTTIDGTDLMTEYAKVAKELNMLHWIGMCENEDYEKISKVGSKNVRIVKPYKDEQKIIDQLKFAEQCGAVAVGMDIDHFFTNKGEIDIVMGEEMEAKTLEQYKTYKNATNLPFIIKGVLSVHDALKCKELGIDGIVISHHGGRLNYAVPPAMMIQEIRKAVGNDMLVFVDCAIESGMDAYKCLALGADAVGIGKYFAKTLREELSPGVIAGYQKIIEELKGAMAYTGVGSCQEFDATVIRRM